MGIQADILREMIPSKPVCFSSLKLDIPSENNWSVKNGGTGIWVQCQRMERTFIIKSMISRVATRVTSSCDIPGAGKGWITEPILPPEFRVGRMDERFLIEQGLLPIPGQQ